MEDVCETDVDAKEIMKDERTMKFGCKKMFGNLTSLEEHR